MKIVLLIMISVYFTTNLIILLLLLKKEFYQIDQYKIPLWAVGILALRVIVLGIPLLIIEQVK